MKYKSFLQGPLPSALAKVYPSHRPTTIVRSLAADVLSEVGAKSTGPPYDPFAIARGLGIEVRYEAIEAEAVFWSKKAERPTILLRKDQQMRNETGWRRLNFTVAHEIGHYAIRRALSGFFPVSQFGNDDPEEEFLCDVFAGELLMPTAIIAKDLTESGFAPDTLLDLTHKYQVSLRSLLCRTTNWARGSLVSAIWTERNGNYRPEWVSPTSYRRLILCDTGRTTVERAFCARGEAQVGRDDFMLNGKRMKWQTISKALSEDQVLTVMHRKSGVSPKNIPAGVPKFELVVKPEGKVLTPTQQLLPFK